MLLDAALATLVIFTEPGGVSGGSARDTFNISIGVAGIGLGVLGGGFELRLLNGRAAVVGSPLVVDAGGREVTREPDLSGIYNSGVEVLGVTISIDVGEEVRWLDRVLSGARLGEVIRSGHW